jgi:hypothetical protein
MPALLLLTGGDPNLRENARENASDKYAAAIVGFGSATKDPTLALVRSNQVTS